MRRYFFSETFLRNRLSNENRPFPRIALFLDYDGTLVPIQKDPSRCVLSERMKEQLRALAGSRNFSLTVLSGRALADIKKRVGIRNICYGGNHGLDISGPGIRFTHPGAAAAKPVLAAVRRTLELEIRTIQGVWLEDKKYTLTLHFRGAKREDIPAVQRKFHKTVAEFPEKGCLAVIRGKKVLELAPGLPWNKGQAALLILEQLGGDCFPVIVGDDHTDETAFKALREKGISIRVGKSGKTSAEYYLKGYWEVLRLLQELTKNS